MKNVLALLALAPLLAGAETETIRKTFTFPDAAAPRRMEVDNVNGNIRVTGHAGANLEVTVSKSIHADSPADAEEAKRDVKLDMSQTANVVRLYVDGPFRCNCRDGESGTRRHGRERYQVKFDFEINVPPGVALDLRTVNDGEIRVNGTSGDFDVDNVNGGVEMLEIAGSGRVHALNGKVKVVFARNPAANSFFGSLNGDVDIAFRPNLSADVRVKTFNGGVFTDFPVESLPTQQAAPERKDGKFVYRSNEFKGLRIGRGGPEYKFDAFNGNIHILNRGQQ